MNVAWPYIRHFNHAIIEPKWTNPDGFSPSQLHWPDDKSSLMIQECCRIVWVWVQLRPMDYVSSNCVELTTKDIQCIVIFFSHFYWQDWKPEETLKKTLLRRLRFLTYLNFYHSIWNKNNRSKQRYNKKQSTASTSIRVVTELSKGCVWVCPVSWLIVFPLSAGQPPPPPPLT